MARNEYPRPQLERKQWTNLNGQWKFAFDDKNVGISASWYTKTEVYDQAITVPFVYQSKESGIEDRTPHDIVWYQREFEASPEKDERVLLHFGAVDYEADIYLNGQHVCHHIGGHTSFEMDITTFLKESGQQQVTVRAFDPHYDETIPRGKQFWEDESAGIWYTNSTGIWQTVWLETVNEQYIQDLKLTPHFDEGKIEIEASISRLSSQNSLEYAIAFKGQPIASGLVDLVTNKVIFEVELYQDHIFRQNYHNEGYSWTPETPNLFDLDLKLREESNEKDTVHSYFGLRKVHAKDGMIYLNNKPYYQKLVLDQGYWPTGLLTAPTDEDFVKDIELAKAMGFNGCRKHQKMEDPRFLYWADTMGFIVWGECAAPPVYTNSAVERLMIEWTDSIKRDYNHPSIITWVPVNESWGVPNISFDRQQQHFSQAIFHYIHSLDTTRLVISNDGWAATDTDIVAIHNYAHGQKEETEKYDYFKETLSSKESLLHNRSTPWPIFADGFSYSGQPIMLTEFGGIGFDVSGQPGWGYTSVTSKEEFVSEYRRVMEALYASKALWGYCYTQMTDVEQEINGLVTYDRQPKCELSKIKEINDGFHIPTVE
ncbi:MAG TPA: glycoside hydrolase family 2 [Candidatus Tetragenococcus pullicola]|nr:glycoside hydrolase family 2 [Candidatus Tetragenococcus pullicola]